MRTRAAGAVVQNDRGELLLVRRAHPPQAGRWTIPGGHAEEGELLQDTAIRETAEETGLVVSVERELGRLDIANGPDETFEVHDFLAHVVSGEICPGDDAADAGWFSVEELKRLPLTLDLVYHLERFGIL